MGGTRHGNVFWEEEKSNVGLRMMQSMGWEHGKGLGSRGHGMTTHIRVRQKKDNAGIGANAATADDAWKATQDVFNSILSRLNDTDAGAMPFLSAVVRNTALRAVRARAHRLTLVWSFPAVSQTPARQLRLWRRS